MQGKIIAVAVEDTRGLQGEVSAHFGRCPAYLLARVIEDSFEEIEIITNPYYDNHRPGVAPPFIRDLGADVILAGGMGPRAVDMFHAQGMEVATGAVGTVEKVLEAYVRGDLRGTAPCAHDHPDSCGKHGAGEVHHG
jgi:predicted Fe-Mo cluster-binding NifX family protein